MNCILCMLDNGLYLSLIMYSSCREGIDCKKNLEWIVTIESCGLMWSNATSLRRWGNIVRIFGDNYLDLLLLLLLLLFIWLKIMQLYCNYYKKTLGKVFGKFWLVEVVYVYVCVYLLE